MLATAMLRDEPDESLPAYRKGVARGELAADPAAIGGKDARFTRLVAEPSHGSTPDSCWE